MYAVARQLQSPVKRSFPVGLIACRRIVNKRVPILGRHLQTNATQTDRVRLAIAHKVLCLLTVLKFPGHYHPSSVLDWF